MRDNLKTEDIDKLCIEWRRLLEKYPNCKIVLTSRYGTIDDEKLARSQHQHRTTDAFSAEQQKQWRQLSEFHPDGWLTRRKLNAFHNESKYEHIREMIEQPLLLHMVASVKNKIDEKATRSKNYEQRLTS